LKYSRRRIPPACVLVLALLGLAGAFGRPASSSALNPGTSAPPGRSAAPARALAQVAGTLLYLPFDGSLTGADGETPTQSSGVTFQSGVNGQGVLVEGSDLLRYATAGNFNAQEGTIELWVKPQWNGNSTSNSCFFGMGDAQYSDGSIVFEKDGGGNLGFTVNRPHEPVPVNVSDWAAGQWHYVAVTWKFPGQVKMYVDGAEKFSRPSVAADVVSAVAQTMTVGSFNTTGQADAVIDEFRVSGVARTPEEIAQSFISDLMVSGLSMQLPLTQMYPTWQKTPTLTAQTNIGTLTIPPSSASWLSSDPSVATVDVNGLITAVAPGTATITATAGGAQASVSFTVKQPMRQPEHEPISSYLSTPAANSLYEIPVVVVRFLPTTDGTNLDTSVNPDFFDPGPITLDQLKQRIDAFDPRVKFMLEEGSRFRGYKNPSSGPSLGYRVVDYITIYEPLPQGDVAYTSKGLPVYFPDMHSVLKRIGAQHLVNDLGVREFWVWQTGLDPGQPSYDPSVNKPEYFRVMQESNMSSPTTGDISNSARDNKDLPVYDHTYVVYGQDFRRTQAEVVHNHGHQLEATLSYVNQRQDGDTALFWQKFVGRDANFNWVRGRCGDTHHPPNAADDYDYQNPNPFDSDIEDWTPAGTGQKKPVSAQTWGGINYSWPSGTLPPQQTESQWYVYWMQNMPGLGNTIPNGAANRMTNWWAFAADWDDAINAGLGLYQPATCAYTLSATSQSFGVEGGAGGVNVTADGVCARTATSNANWITVNSGASGTGPGAISFTVAANSGVTRTGTLAIAGQTFTVTQAGAVSCAYTLSPASSYIGSGGGSGIISVTATPGDCPWSAVSNDPWLTVVSATPSSGGGTVTYSAAADSGGVTRTGTLTVAGQTVTVTQTTTANPIDDTRFYVRQHYLDFLSREPDSSGLNFWTNDITSCGADAQCAQVHRVNVSGAFFLSIEFQETGYLVERIYKTAYGDATGNSTLGGAHTLAVPVVRLQEFLPDTQEIGSRPNQVIVNQGPWQQQLEENKQAFALEFVLRPRFLAAFPAAMTPSVFVDKLNANAGSVLTQAQHDALVSQLSAAADQATGRAAVLRAVAESPALSAAEKNRAFVLIQYFGYLRRNPNDPQDTDYTGYDFWLQKLDQFNGDFIKAEMVNAFISSIEYRKRFGP
jgi:hypothetical protein